MKIAFLINNAYGIGGTIRSTANLSRAFADRHEVEVVSVHRSKDTPAIPFDSRVKLTTLIDTRSGSRALTTGPLTQRPCTMFPGPAAPRVSGRTPYSALHDDRIGRWLRTTDADVVIATRPDLNGYLARDGQSRCVRVGQEHLSLAGHSDAVRTAQNGVIGRLDAFVTVSEADAAAYRAALPDVPTRVRCIPNGVPAPVVEGSARDADVIVAAGRLIPVKRYDRLVDAFARVADAHPTWTLRLYGRGPKQARLREQIDRLGLYERVQLMGSFAPIETEWAKGSIAAVSSDKESFGMTIVEAMHCGVPVIATDCPHGPGEIITHDHDGVLVPLDSGAEGYAYALDRLMSDRELRARLAAGALRRAADFAPERVAERYEDLFHALGAGRVPAQAAPAPWWRRLRAALLPVRARPPRRATDSRPLASARSGADGEIVFRFPAASLPWGELDLLARLRRDPKGREVRVPLPAGRASEVRVTLDPLTHPLAEGRWDCYVVPRGATRGRKRLVCEVAERARRVGRAPLTAPDGETVSALPYATVDGFLAVRAWRRPAHAEVTRIAVGAEGTTVRAALSVPATGAVVVAVSRQGESGDFSLPVTPDGAGLVFTLPHARPVAAPHSRWDLYLRVPAHEVPVALGRIGGDIIDRNKTDLVPATRRDGTEARVFFTGAHNLAFEVRTP
ncbi:glycosyltransferase [Streptomyces sp. NPDC058426]|uniref:glycosyltransferase n=1 Tax=Streptomyces sp. NPDC058426 TaxID=3346493 RepID=UPI0036513844